MAKIIYGVSGEGSGHSSRAKLVARHLLDAGHTVKIVSYDRGLKNLRDEFDVQEVVGLSIASRDNKVSMLKTISENAAKLPEGIRKFKQLKKVFTAFQPDCVLTDFEPTTAYLARHYKLPLISMDNQHRMRYMTYDYPAKLKKDALITQTIIRAMIPKPWYSLFTSFHYGELKNNHCAVFPPILRPKVMEISSSHRQHTLVYATSAFESLVENLKSFPSETFYIYGFNKDETLGNLHFKLFSEQGFLDDLASCKAVIATAGFTLISESLYFKKPYLALPIQGQFEQCLNAHMLDQKGLGKSADAPSIDVIASFFYFLNDYKKALASYSGFGNDALCQRLDELLANDMEELKRYSPY